MKKIRIAIIDDEDIILLMEKYLVSLGYKVDMYQGLWEFINKKVFPDVIITDFCFDDATRIIRGIKAECPDVKIIIQSGWITDIEGEALKRGKIIEEYLEKIDFELNMESIVKLLNIVEAEGQDFLLKTAKGVIK